MIPVLYASNTASFSTFGIGTLTDTISCEVTEERNGLFECLLRYPVADGARNYVADVADLCQKLGAEYAWDEAAGTATATYRGVTITLTAGSATALVDGEAMELYTDCTLEDGTEQRVELPVLEEDGTVSALITVFTQSWSMDVEVEREGGDVPVYTGFIVIP